MTALIEDAACRHTPQDLDAELDRVMRVNPYWRNLMKEEGREVAKLELMFELSSIEIDQVRRKEKRAEDERNLIILSELNAYLESRDKFKGTLEEAMALDAEFMKLQEGKGHNLSAWLDEWGTTISDEITKLQKSEKSAEEHRQWLLQTKRQAIEAEAKRLQMRLEEYKLKAEITAEANGREAFKIIQSLIDSGVLKYA